MKASAKLRPKQQLLEVRTADGLRPGVVRRVESTDPSVVASSWPATEFCRLARKLRAVYGRKPLEMHRRLSRLAVPPRPFNDEDHLPRHRMVDTDEPATDDGFAGSRDRTFAARVLRTLRDQNAAPLRYSQRLELLKEAGRRGIGRFEANLVIASVQHRLKSDTPVEAPRASARVNGMLAYVLMQTMILWGAWRVMKS